ncbi:unnamed protein product [Amoebophrya sp. A25]|nr:unnamed protein product [Amoebophrya sp. A25]|eukprot:GSA25T00007778001.1
MMNAEEERAWSAKILGTSTRDKPQAQQPVYSDDVPTLREENRELKRLLRDLVFFDVSRGIVPKDEQRKHGAGSMCDKSNIEMDVKDKGFYDLPLPIQAEYILLNMQKRFNDASTYVKQNCVIQQPAESPENKENKVTTSSNTSTLDVVKKVIKNATDGVDIYKKWQYDSIDVNRFDWTKQRMEKKKNIDALDEFLGELTSDLKEHATTNQDLTKVRRSIGKKISKQQKEGLQWKNTKEEMNKHLSILEHCYEYISNPSYNFIRENSNEPYVPQIIRGMRTTISELMRQNRELELKLAFAERQKKKFITKIKALYEDEVRGSSVSSEASSLAQVAKAGAVDVSGFGASSSSTSGVNLDECIWPGTSSWRGPALEKLEQYVPITRPNARGKPVQFLNFLLACNGHMPFEFLFAVTKDDLKSCINFLGCEYVENVLRTKGLECAFQNLQETRFLTDINAAVRYLVASISCVLRCDRASYWIVDTNRGFAWTKSAGGAGMAEICIPLDVGLIGEAIAQQRAVNVADAYMHPKFNKAIDMRTGYRTRSVLCVPIIVKGKTVAVIQAINKLSTMSENLNGNPIFDERDVFMLHVLGYGMTDVVLSCEEIELDTQINRRKDLLIAATGDLFLHCHQKSDLLLMLNKYLANLFRANSATIILLYYDHMARLERNESGDMVEKVCLDKNAGLAGLCVHERASLHCGNIKEDPRYRPDLIDLVVGDLASGDGTGTTVALHSWPLYRGRLLSAVIQWSCEQRSRVDFGDDGSFNEQSNRHADLLHKMLILIQVYLEIWYPTLERLQSGIQKRARRGMKMARLLKRDMPGSKSKGVFDAAGGDKQPEPSEEEHEN